MPSGMDRLFAAMVMQEIGEDPTAVKYIQYDGGDDSIAALLSGKFTNIFCKIGHSVEKVPFSAIACSVQKIRPTPEGFAEHSRYILDPLRIYSTLLILFVGLACAVMFHFIDFPVPMLIKLGVMVRCWSCTCSFLVHLKTCASRV